MSKPKHKAELRSLTEEEGGGWLATFPELPGCISDGESPEEALFNAAEAERAWLAADEQFNPARSFIRDKPSDI